MHLRSRNDKDFSRQFGSIVRALEQIPDETLIDGELVALDEEGRPSFNLLQNYGASQAPIVYCAFDILVLRGRNVVGEPLRERRELLHNNVLVKLEEPVRLSPELDAHLPDLIRSVREQGLDGLIAERRESVYEPGQRSGAWQKMRINEGQEFVIGGYTPGPKNFDALVFGYYAGDKLMYAGGQGAGSRPLSGSTCSSGFENSRSKLAPFLTCLKRAAEAEGKV